jgi:hypothetical protein
MVDVCKYSMVDAGRLALEVSPIRRSRARDEILLGAARLWCRDLTAPTVRAIGAAVGRSPVTVLGPFRSARHLYAHVIRLEWDLVESGWYLPGREQAWAFLGDHVEALSSVDRVLLRLPALVHAALSGDSVAPPGGGIDARSSILYLLAAHATTSTPLDAVLAQLRQIEEEGLEAA